jgi:hypothetical protein
VRRNGRWSGRTEADLGRGIETAGDPSQVSRLRAGVLGAHAQFGEQKKAGPGSWLPRSEDPNQGHPARPGKPGTRLE